MQVESREQQVFSAIADPIRREIVTLLARRPRAVRELATHFEVSRPAVSRHLRVLRQARLVEERRQGRERIYSACLTPLGAVREWLDLFWDQRLQILKSLAEE